MVFDPRYRKIREIENKIAKIESKRDALSKIIIIDEMPQSMIRRMIITKYYEKKIKRLHAQKEKLYKEIALLNSLGIAR